MDKTVAIKNCVGTFPIRNLGHSENGIHMPRIASGEYVMYAEPDGSVIVLVRR